MKTRSNQTKILFAVAIIIILASAAYYIGKIMGKYIAEKEKTEIVSHI